VIVAIKKLGGIDRAQIKKQAGVSMLESGKTLDKNNHVFGRPVFRANNGLTLDRMREALVEEGYLNDDSDINDLLNLIDEAVLGSPATSVSFDYTEDDIAADEQRYAESQGFTLEAKYLEQQDDIPFKREAKFDTDTVGKFKRGDLNNEAKFKIRPEESDTAVQLSNDLIKQRSTASRKASVLANAITKSMLKEGGASLIGQKVNSAGDLAALAQVLRNPQYETFRVFFTKKGKVVGHTGVSSRLPGASYVFVGKVVFSLQ